MLKQAAFGRGRISPTASRHARFRERSLAYNVSMDHSKLVLVQAFGSEADADLAKSMLESAGIDSTIQADTAGGMRDHLAWSGFGFKVLVREEDAATARDVLTLTESQLVLLQAFGTQAEADLAQGALLEAGIVATAEADPSGGSFGQGRVRVLVREEDASAAREVLNVNPLTKPVPHS